MTPKHYIQNEYQPIKVNWFWSGSNFEIGNILKYLNRAGKKGGESKEKDLTKILDYIDFLEDSPVSFTSFIIIERNFKADDKYFLVNVLFEWEFKNSPNLSGALGCVYDYCLTQDWQFMELCKKYIKEEIKNLV